MNARTSPSHAHLTNILGAFVTNSHDRLDAAFQDELGVGGGAPSAILALRTWPGFSIDQLRVRVGLSHSGAVRLVGRLERSGLVRKSPGSDLRSVALHLTRRGGAMARRILDHRTELVSGILDPLTRADKETLEALLHKILREPARTRVEAQHACRQCDHTVCVGNECPIGASVGAESP